ncbi:MAG: peptidoglycan DD-metalloendopeptidase family protein [Clostridia bacterium]|nr:peptidoglycan DD-metalloendopeptidase family protein [Clostridia bacterium]
MAQGKHMEKTKRPVKPAPPREEGKTWAPTRPPRGGFWPWLHTKLYVYSYYMGAFLRGTWRVFFAWLIALLTPVGQAVARLWKRTVGLQWKRLRFECHQIAYDYRLGRERVAVAAEEGRRGLMILLAVLVPFMTLRRHRRFFHVIFQGVVVTASALILVGVIRYWENTTFALELVYGGRSIGYITDESVFNEAVDMAEGRIIKNADGYVIERESYLTLRPVQQSKVLSKSQLCDEILKLSGSNVAEMSGLYVDGVFEGALLSREQMEMLLDAILAEYQVENTTQKRVAEFMNQVEIVDGLYPVGAEEPYEVLWNRLTEKDEAGNPYLTVQIRCTEVYKETIPFQKTTVKDNTKYIGYKAIRTKGENGERKVTADVIYVNGVEISREVIAETVVKEPVTEVTVIGNYRVNENARPGVATGEFIWPLPSCRMVNSPFGYRWGKLHAGVDISGNGVNGKDIIASDGGVVKQVNASGWGGGYGLYVIIDHGNGYNTVYAHCSAILVSAGQKITQGQVIAKVGNTGNSFGPHLHFEIRINGSAVDPMPYVD